MAVAVAVAVAVSGGGAVAVAVAGLTKRFLNHIQKDFSSNVCGYCIVRLLGGMTVPRGTDIFDNNVIKEFLLIRGMGVSLKVLKVFSKFSKSFLEVFKSCL